MTLTTLRAVSAGLLLLGATGSAWAHGLVMDPPARNWFCGAITKPDEVQNGTAQFPICGDAFFAPGLAFEDGYQFMSVLTHSRGHAGPAFPAPTFPPNTTSPPHVCSFSSQTWNNNNPALNRATPWDQPINWPTTTITSGLRNFTWNISWGPHFGDSEDFTYWITRPGFVYQVGQPLTWADFETTPFCDENVVYNGFTQVPNGNPDIIMNTGGNTITTRCTVPSRPAGSRHVIYAEWGRLGANSTPPGGTDERFHGCIDVVFQGGGRNHRRRQHHRQPAADGDHGGRGRTAQRQRLDVLHRLPADLHVDGERAEPRTLLDRKPQRGADDADGAGSGRREQPSPSP